MIFRQSSYHILRVGMAITFLWIGLLIFKEPEAWGGFLQPWAVSLLPVSLKSAMIGAAMLDVFIGVLFLIDWLSWLAALLGSFQLLVILAVSGINAITIRDLGLLAGALALLLASYPKKV